MALPLLPVLLLAASVAVVVAVAAVVTAYGGVHADSCSVYRTPCRIASVVKARVGVERVASERLRAGASVASPPPFSIAATRVLFHEKERGEAAVASQGVEATACNASASP